MRPLVFLLAAIPVVALRQPTVTRASVSLSEPKKYSSPQKVVASAILALSVAITPANALDSAIFTNEYADPFHPNCERKIQVSKDGKTFHYSGTAVGPKGEEGPLRGCSAEEIKLYKLRKGAFDGEILDSNRISAGDGIHEGVWEPKNSVSTNLGFEDVDGIRWNDGNKWVVKSQARVVKSGEGEYAVEKKPFSEVAGEFFFYSYIGFSTLAGAKGIVDGMKRKQEASG